jgi:CubicO group peptidase (beta-lactamase class C family)
VLLGLLIERLSGQSYSAYLEDHLLRPLGLADTAYDDAREIVAHRASGYARSGSSLTNALPISVAATYAAGGLRSTADDLLRWDQALHAGRLLRPASLAAMFTDYGHGYGFGAFIEVRSGHRLWDHGGNLPGFSSAFDHYPDDGLTVIVLSNIEGDASEKIAHDLAQLFFAAQAPAHGEPRAR